MDRLPVELVTLIRSYLLPSSYRLCLSPFAQWGHQARALEVATSEVRKNKVFTWHRKMHNFYFVHSLPRLTTRFQRCVLEDKPPGARYMIRDISQSKEYSYGEVYFGRYCFWLLPQDESTIGTPPPP